MRACAKAPFPAAVIAILDRDTLQQVLSGYDSHKSRLRAAAAAKADHSGLESGGNGGGGGGVDACSDDKSGGSHDEKCADVTAEANERWEEEKRDEDEEELAALAYTRLRIEPTRHRTGALVIAG